ncbi:MAG: PolC-type DNA polymerase III [Mogibacterium sp.]|nr:PolC-type DNA polymerase III [Mogibacterium sp.]
MIRIPAGMIDPSELAAQIGKPEKEIDLEFTDLTIDRTTFELTVHVKLNFVMPVGIEADLRRSFLEKSPALSDVKFDYTYAAERPKVATVRESVRAAQPARQSANDRGFERKKATHVKAGKPVLGQGVTREPISFDEAYQNIGTKGEKAVEGTVFKKEVTQLKNGRSDLLILLIRETVNALCVKCFVDKKEIDEVTTKVRVGDRVRVLGHIEYDKFEQEMVFRAKGLDVLEQVRRADTHQGAKRVELHAHTKMSDYDGFNEIDEMITQAAEWGQPAVAITDHGVVQAFPDALKTQKKLKKSGKNIKVIYGMEGYLYDDTGCIGSDGRIDYRRHGTYHIILLAATQEGIRNLYELVSLSHVDYFYKRPRLPRSVLDAHRNGLILGSACEAGELYRAMRNGASDEELLRIASYYDYLEIQPLGNNQFMIDDGLVGSEQDLIDNNLRILSIADRLGKLCIATTDSHYPTPEAAIYRNIIMRSKGFTETASNSLYLRTTDQMLEEFRDLGDRAEEVVITNTNKVADMIADDISPISPEKCPPMIEDAENLLRTACYEKVKSIYGDPIPESIYQRLNIELESIIKNGYASLYIAAKRLVEKSMSDGYLVGSRGSVGSSFAATMAGITEVNPLPPHYICPECKHFEYYEGPQNYDVGYDMPDKNCPVCGARMKKEGMNIPFATFLGFDGDKEPDIDLNFAGEYQPIIHDYVSTIFGGKCSIYKAGTVQTVESKTAFGHVKHFIDETGYKANKYDIELLVAGCTGVKRTTGQHPGGMIIVPEGRDINEFCPVQRPANKGDVITTHFDYHSIESNLLKLDLLGHNVPQMIRHLQLMTGVDPMTIPLDDKATLSLFTSTDALHITNPDYQFVHGTYGVPEFGTKATRVMLDEVRPTTVSELIKISGFAHGTNVWANNVQDLLHNGVATMEEVISSRDDIMNFLISKGVENSTAFKIMEVVRKNKRELNEEEIAVMTEHGVPEWYIWSCNTLEYLFPRAHATAYVMMAIRMGWYKVNYPAAFYAAWFTSKLDDFDIEVAMSGLDGVIAAMKEVEELGDQATPKQKTKTIVYEVMYEMFSRGYEFAAPRLGVSHAEYFDVLDGKVLIPFAGVAGVGGQAAESIVTAYNERPFASLDDVRRFTKLSGTNIDDLKKYGVFGDIPDSAQISIFDFV